MRIKINDKIYRLKEIESGVDSLMELVEEPKFKDGDFVVNMKGSVLIFKKKVGDRIYDHALFNSVLGLSILQEMSSDSPIMRHANEWEKERLLDELAKKGKRWNEEKKCVEDIPKRKFQNGDKVRIKDGISSKTHRYIRPTFVEEMDELIGTTMTVSGYTYENGYVVCKESSCRFHEDWLEHCEGLKKGDLAIFWDDDNERYASVRFYERLSGSEGECPRHRDQNGFYWDNAIKFESKEQYERFIKGEL